jgi:hypothetical protein
MDQALRGVLTQLTHAAYKQGGIPDRKFYDYVSHIDPRMELETRKELGLDQPTPGDLDGRLRALTDAEVNKMVHRDELGDIFEGEPQSGRSRGQCASGTRERLERVQNGEILRKPRQDRRRGARGIPAPRHPGIVIIGRRTNGEVQTRPARQLERRYRRAG